MAPSFPDSMRTSFPLRLAARKSVRFRPYSVFLAAPLHTSEGAVLRPLKPECQHILSSTFYSSGACRNTFVYCSHKRHLSVYCPSSGDLAFPPIFTCYCFHLFVGWARL